MLVIRTVLSLQMMTMKSGLMLLLETPLSLVLPSWCKEENEKSYQSLQNQEQHQVKRKEKQEAAIQHWTDREQFEPVELFLHGGNQRQSQILVTLLQELATLSILIPANHQFSPIRTKTAMLVLQWNSSQLIEQISENQQLKQRSLTTTLSSKIISWIRLQRPENDLPPWYEPSMSHQPLLYESFISQQWPRTKSRQKRSTSFQELEQQDPFTIKY